jgi:ribose transport system substrate-binding protein
MVTLVIAALVTTASASSVSNATQKAKAAAPTKLGVIALSNGYTGNYWRLTMIKTWEAEANQAKSEGLISGWTVENTPDNSATEQISQIKTLILEKVSAITIDSASGTALNSVIEEACHQGIVVVAFDSLASAACEYNITSNYYQLGIDEAAYVINALHGKGNVILLYGIAGSVPANLIYAGSLAEVHKFPNIHLVGGKPDTEASESKAESLLTSLLPSLPHVQGVIADGTGYGALEAFAHLSLPAPVTDFGIDGVSLSLLVGKLKADPKFSAVAIGSQPGLGSCGFWAAIDVLQHTTINGKPIPKSDLYMPFVIITPATAAKWLAVTPATAFATYVFTRQEVNTDIADNLKKLPLAIPPIPTSVVK